jgi:hypothetical protein
MQSFALDSDDYLFFDIFHKNNKLYLICPVYSVGIDISKLSIFHNGSTLVIIEKYSEIHVEPVEVLIYSHSSSGGSILVEYNGTQKEFTLEHIRTTVHPTLSVSTEFKDDYRLINIFYNYYKNQGVTNFYMYYNGKLTDDIRQMYNLPGVVLIEWNFRWKNTLSDKYLFVHHSQPAQMHHALYRYGKDVNEYMIMCDLDEYMYIPAKKLVNYIREHPAIDMFGFRNVWSDTIDGNIPSTLPNRIRTSNEWHTFKYRSKCIYKTELVLTLTIHYGTRFKRPVQILTDNILLHFYKWSGRDRSKQTENIVTLVLV